MKIPEGVKPFLSDLCNARLLVIKALYFTLLAGAVIVWPQLTVHQHHLGLTQYQTAVCSASVSAVAVFIPFCSGFVGDKLGNYKKLLCIVTLLSGLTALLFTAVPSARINTTSVATPLTNTNDVPVATPLHTTPHTNTIITTHTTPHRDTNATHTTPLTDTTPTLAALLTTTTPPPINTTTTKTTEVDEELLSFTFWLYLGVRVCYGGLQAVGYTLFEASVMAHTQKHGVNYGYQRAWGTLAVIISSYLSGQLITLTGSFSVIFYVSAGLQLLAAGLVLLLRLEFKLPAQKLTWNILKQIRQAKVVMFFTAMLSAGVFFGYLETFMYRYLVSLGASPVLVSLTVTVGAPFELVLTLFTSYIVSKVGHEPLIMFGLLAHAVRLFGLSLLVDPWWVLPLEVFESLSNGVMGTAAVMYCTSLFTLQSIASFRGIYAVVYFGIGQLLGAMVGAEVREVFGDVNTFRIMSAAALVSFMAYCCSFYTLMKCRSGSITTITTTTATRERGGGGERGGEGGGGGERRGGGRGGERGGDNPNTLVTTTSPVVVAVMRDVYTEGKSGIDNPSTHRFRTLVAGALWCTRTCHAVAAKNIRLW
ncbi:hypothetical protein Pmani_022030 [Petrolisthes manimaculis]|uniref:Major facilitator superfamily associated domain-containing protein n=1 Tax=Petrolisthes manimaculis TaxID=1843537 RepID=A0AAE1U4U5_9EUCA|nr:hypothetical protein Pmani_022030 [Petrolisthes manimaculis]